MKLVGNLYQGVIRISSDVAGQWGVKRPLTQGNVLSRKDEGRNVDKIVFRCVYQARGDYTHYFLKN